MRGIPKIAADDDVLKKLPQISAFKAYPTLFAVDRKGVVRAVHTGYLGPAAGKHHEQQNRDHDDEQRARPGSLP